jgi:nucleotide-binding universal stress UspA family protein
MHGPTSESSREERQGPCVVVGYDGGESSRDAVGWAAATLPEDGRLVLVYACRGLHTPPSPLVGDVERDRVAHATFDALALDGDDAFLALAAHNEIVDMDPVNALLDTAARYGAGMIVVGRNRHSLLRRSLGTVTGELLARTRVPVVLVPSPAT